VRGAAPAAWRDTGWRGAVLAAGDSTAGRRNALVSGRAVVELAPDRSAALGFGQSAAGLADAASGRGGVFASLVGGRSDGFMAARDVAGAALAQRFGAWTATAAVGEARLEGDSPVRARRDPARATTALGGAFAAAVAWLRERRASPCTGALLAGTERITWPQRGAAIVAILVRVIIWHAEQGNF
jgi:hypothetical protein